MLISFDEILPILHQYKIQPTGVLHIGAHECEELLDYTAKLKISKHNIIWIDGLKAKVDMMKSWRIPNVYHAIITNKDNDIVQFHVANNGQSSSILLFDAHCQEHPDISFVHHIQEPTITIDTFMHKNNINCEFLNFWNLDIQGAELMALQGATNSLQHVKVIYIEVNVKHLYAKCPLINDIDDFLMPLGFTRTITKITLHGWGDALYVRT
jgi:FkbM family methyltransferase